MKATRKIITLAIFATLFSTETNLAQAGSSFSFDKAAWESSRNLLVYIGHGEPGSIVDVYLSRTNRQLAQATVNSKGAWLYRIRDPKTIPCTVRAESGSSSTETAVLNAPANCLTGEDVGGNSTPPPKNTRPVISGTPRTQVAEGQAYSFRPTASDADNDDLTFSIVNRPAWARFNSSTGQLSGTPNHNNSGTTRNVRISVSDGTARASLSAFNITVSNTNRAPTISGAPATSVAEGASYRFSPAARDADGDNLTFSIANRPSWANFNASTGVLSGTPGSNASGVYSNIIISVSDGSTRTSLAPFRINVADVAQRASTGGTFRFARNRYDVNEGNTATLTVTRSNSSGTASVNYGTYGVDAVNNRDYTGYTWTPLSFQNGESSKTIRLTTLPDTTNEGAESLEVHLNSPSRGYALSNSSVSVVTIHDVEASNTAPVISGTPARSITAGTAYHFTPSASDADKDKLTFRITNRPSWATFNANTGTLSGTPTNNDAGSYSNIVISVTDGTANASLSPINLTVNAAQAVAATGSATLSWVAPSARTDGSSLSLSEIAGYRVYMGTNRNNLEAIVDLDDSSLTRHRVEDLRAGTYYFALTAYDRSGNESELSNIATKRTN
ncbi:MAG: putative Ig domain-containing protein [Candidatus Thiodiazotropha sp.]|jgi:hypothetical protein